jgi:hypothetical protein
VNYQPLSEAECRRIKRLPEMLDAARRKLAALEREAERRGLHDLLKPEKQA